MTSHALNRDIDVMAKNKKPSRDNHTFAHVFVTLVSRNWTRPGKDGPCFLPRQRPVDVCVCFLGDFFGGGSSIL